MANFGETLRRERELRDISLREIADATKVNLRYLEALEQNRFDILPGGVFNKGFIRAYARFIGADGESLVDRYLQEMAEREARAQAAAGVTPLAPGLHRPPEAPRRRSGPDPAPPAPARAASAAPASAPPWTRATPAPEVPAIPVAETVTRPIPAVHPTPAAAPHPPAATVTAARPEAADRSEAAERPEAATRPAPAARPAPAPSAQHAPIFEAETAAIGSRDSGRLMTTTLWVAGAIVIAFLGIWVIRGLRAGSPAQAKDTAPSTSPAGAGGNEDAATTPPGAEPAAAPADQATGQGLAGAGVPGDAAAPATLPGITATPASPLIAPAAGAVGTGVATGAPPGPVADTAAHEAEPSRRDDSIEHPIRSAGAQPQASPQPTSASQQTSAPRPAGATRGGATQAAVASAVPPPAPREESRPAAPAPSAAGRGGMDFRIEATAPVWVQVACDGDERLNQALQPGQGYSMRCLSFVRLSVTDIAAVRLSVNGGRCVAPGDRGARVEGFVIRAEDATAICPIQQGALHGSR